MRWKAHHPGSEILETTPGLGHFLDHTSSGLALPGNFSCNDLLGIQQRGNSRYDSYVLHAQGGEKKPLLLLEPET